MGTGFLKRSCLNRKDGAGWRFQGKAIPLQRATVRPREPAAAILAHLRCARGALRLRPSRRDGGRAAIQLARLRSRLARSWRLYACEFYRFAEAALCARVSGYRADMLSDRSVDADRRLPAGLRAGSVAKRSRQIHPSRDRRHAAVSGGSGPDLFLDHRSRQQWFHQRDPAQSRDRSDSRSSSCSPHSAWSSRLSM